MFNWFWDTCLRQLACQSRELLVPFHFCLTCVISWLHCKAGAAVTRHSQGSSSDGVGDSIHPKAASAIPGLRKLLPPLDPWLSQGGGPTDEAHLNLPAVRLDRGSGCCIHTLIGTVHNCTCSFVPTPSPSVCRGGRCIRDESRHCCRTFNSRSSHGS